MNQIIFGLIQRLGVVYEDGKPVRPYATADWVNRPQGGMEVHGGCTLIFDLDSVKLNYAISRRLLKLETIDTHNRTTRSGSTSSIATKPRSCRRPCRSSANTSGPVPTVISTNRSPYCTHMRYATMPSRKSGGIDQVVIRMYKMGTGDCFTVKFLKGGKVSFKMLIDCGCWSGTKESLKPFLEEMKNDVEGRVDVLVVTHEHKDHVLGFERGRDLFTGDAFQAGQVWMAWTEKDGDFRIEQWKKDYGEKKRSLAAAAKKLSGVDVQSDFENQFTGSHEKDALCAGRKKFAEVLTGFAELHATAEYAEALAGMAVVKDEIARDNVSYFEPGKVIENVPGLEGVRIFVLGPPTVYGDVKVEEGPAGQAYEHNDQLEDTDAFAAALDAFDGANSSRPLPFDDSYISGECSDRAAYKNPNEAWRRIDYDWLFCAGSLALRMNSRTNNLSLVLAIEIVRSGKVLLFPGDAEFGSWRSWHQIDWETKVENLTTEKLLNRVVFYKVAHHLSHHGTARSVGLDMMTHPELVAMATLDYNVIPPGWTSTMPNVGIIKDLLERTKGRTIIMNTDQLLFSRKDNTRLEPKIEEYRKRMTDKERKAFKKRLVESDLYISLTLDV